MITSKKLLELGIKPDKYFGIVLKYCKENNVIDPVEILGYYRHILPDQVEPREVPAHYSQFITADTAEATQNINLVRKTMNQVMRTPYVLGGAIMPDACPSGPLGNIPVGGVVVMDNVIVPSMHSADICCSLMTTYLSKYVSPAVVLKVAKNVTHFGFGSNPLFEGQLPDSLRRRILANKITKPLLKYAEKSLGTQGDGNHFLSVGTSRATGYTTITTHHGSRSFGAQIYREGKKIAEKFRRELAPKCNPINAFIPFETQEGRDYWEALQIARDFAKENHAVIHEKIAMDLGLSQKFLLTKDSIWNEHNFVFKVGNKFYHAKGATPMKKKFTPDNGSPLRIIPLNMSEDILIVISHPESETGFAPHGAGRNFSRTAFENKNITSQQLENSLAGVKYVPYSGEVDYSEFPDAYKDSTQVMSDMGKFNLAIVTDKIKPYGCIMAGKIKPYWKQ